MTSQSSDDVPEEKNQDENEQDSTNEDHLQRKRSRVVSHPDEELENKVNNETTDEINNERASTPIENPDGSDTTNNTGQTKRRKLNVDVEDVPEQDEQTNDSVQSSTTTTNSESKDESSTTTTTSTTTDDDDDGEDTKDEEDDTENTDEQNDLPPTKNIYLRLRQRELGIFHRPKERMTCRAFHNNMIASRSLVQRMQISHTLDGHEGCVNALAFNRTGKFQSFP
jgi:hypothetical protein